MREQIASENGGLGRVVDFFRVHGGGAAYSSTLLLGTGFRIHHQADRFCERWYFDLRTCRDIDPRPLLRVAFEKHQPGFHTKSELGG